MARADDDGEAREREPKKGAVHRYGAALKNDASEKDLETSPDGTALTGGALRERRDSSG